MMERFMNKRMWMGVAAIAMAMSLAGSAGASNDGPCYDILWYDDAMQTTQVGYGRGRCFAGGPGTVLIWGTNTPYEEFQEIGQCIDGVLYPS
jgi:hypothetical protein